MLNLAQHILLGIRYYPEAPALIHGEQIVRYCDFGDRVRKVASVLQEAGIKPGDKVGLMIPNRPDFTISYFGILLLGATVVPLNILLVRDEVAYTLDDSDAVALITERSQQAGVEGAVRSTCCRSLFLAADSGAVPGVRPGSETGLAILDLDDLCRRASETVKSHAGSPDETAVILYTSGTTGRPKGAELSHSNLLWNAQCANERLFADWPRSTRCLGPGEVGLAALPLYHSFGQTAIQNALLFGGGAVCYLERFNGKAVLQSIARWRVTLFAGVPTMYFGILESWEKGRRDISSLKYCLSGGAALPVEMKRQIEDKLGVSVQEAYGLSETSPMACSQPVTDTSKAGSIGKPIWGVEMIVADDACNPVPPGETGEILIRGHNIMKGYYKRPEATVEAMRGGWFHSGDIGKTDEDGDFYIVDRKKDLIIRGGYNVYPREVEEVLYTHPAVREAAVVGVSDPKYGEEVTAHVSLHSPVREIELIQFCKEHLAAYKYPRSIVVVDELPKGPTGKILRRELR